MGQKFYKYEIRSGKKWPYKPLSRHNSPAAAYRALKKFRALFPNEFIFCVSVTSVSYLQMSDALLVSRVNRYLKKREDNA